MPEENFLEEVRKKGDAPLPMLPQLMQRLESRRHLVQRLEPKMQVRLYEAIHRHYIAPQLEKLGLTRDEKELAKAKWIGSQMSIKMPTLPPEFGRRQPPPGGTRGALGAVAEKAILPAATGGAEGVANILGLMEMLSPINLGQKAAQLAGAGEPPPTGTRPSEMLRTAIKPAQERMEEMYPGGPDLLSYPGITKFAGELVPSAMLGGPTRTALSKVPMLAREAAGGAAYMYPFSGPDPAMLGVGAGGGVLGGLAFGGPLGRLIAKLRGKAGPSGAGAAPTGTAAGGAAPAPGVGVGPVPGTLYPPASAVHKRILEKVLGRTGSVDDLMEAATREGKMKEVAELMGKYDRAIKKSQKGAEKLTKKRELELAAEEARAKAPQTRAAAVTDAEKQATFREYAGRGPTPDEKVRLKAGESIFSVLKNPNAPLKEAAKPRVKKPTKPKTGKAVPKPAAAPVASPADRATVMLEKMKAESPKAVEAVEAAEELAAKAATTGKKAAIPTAGETKAQAAAKLVDDIELDTLLADVDRSAMSAGELRATALQRIGDKGRSVMNQIKKLDLEFEDLTAVTNRLKAKFLKMHRQITSKKFEVASKPKKISGAQRTAEGRARAAAERPSDMEAIEAAAKGAREDVHTVTYPQAVAPEAAAIEGIDLVKAAKRHGLRKNVQEAIKEAVDAGDLETARAVLQRGMNAKFGGGRGL